MDGKQRRAAAIASQRHTPMVQGPTSVDSKLRTALSHHRAGRLADAKRLYAEILSEEPKHADALHLLGVVKFQEGDPGEAANLIGKAIAVEPDYAEAHNNLGNVMLELRDLDAALAAYRMALELKPDYGHAHNNLGNALRAQGKLEEAVATFRKALELKPDNAAAHNNLGLVLAEQGDLEKAVGHYRRALAINPNYAEPYLNLAEACRHSPGDPEFARIGGLLDNAGLSRSDRAILHFALATMYDDCEEFDKAFANAEIANNLDRHHFNAGDLAQFVADSISTFSKEFFGAREELGGSSKLPIFIVGMPRSGKSLMEHVVASHPCAFAGGELTNLGQISRALPGIIGTELTYPRCMPMLGHEAACSLADSHIEFLRGLGGDAVRVIDTMPDNFLWLGLIALLFPDAHVIDCRRQPLDVGVECYFRNINASQAFASDLTDIGLFYRQYERFMEHWRRVLPLPVLEVRYEELVGNPEPVIRRIIDFCGLQWDDRCLASQYRSRPAPTDPSAQKKGPIDPSFVGRWKHYDRFLDPLRAGLG